MRQCTCILQYDDYRPADRDRGDVDFLADGIRLCAVRAPGKNFMFTLVLATLMLPSVGRLVPTYVLFAKLGWVGTFLLLIIRPLAGGAFDIFLLRQFFMTIRANWNTPRERTGAAAFASTGTSYCPWQNQCWRL